MPQLKTYPLPIYEPDSKTFQMHIALKICDNEADTFEMALRNLGFKGVSLRRKSHVEISYRGKPDIAKLGKKITLSGIVLNTNKEAVKFSFEEKKPGWFSFAKSRQSHDEGAGFIAKKILVRERIDFVGLSKLSALQKRLKMDEITALATGTAWEFMITTKSKTVAEETFKKILSTNLFFNPHRQEAYSLGSFS